MINIKSFGSSSKGNGYLIDDGHSQLLIEAGILFKKVKEKMNHDFKRVAGCFITHEHNDHAKYVHQIIKDTSIDIFATKGTLNELEIKDYRGVIIKPNTVLKLATWKISAFKINHDAADPVGYIFENQMHEKVLFITDTYYVNYKFPGVTHMMVEMNYSEEILKEKMNQGFEKKLADRIRKSHFEMNYALDFIAKNKSSKLQEVWLLHLSESNSDANLFKEKTQKLTGVPVYIA